MKSKFIFFIKNHQNPLFCLKCSNFLPQKSNVLTFSKGSQKVQWCQVETIIAPSSGGVGRKTRYLGLCTQSVLSCKLVFISFGAV